MLFVHSSSSICHVIMVFFFDGRVLRSTCDWSCTNTSSSLVGLPCIRACLQGWKRTSKSAGISTWAAKVTSTKNVYYQSPWLCLGSKYSKLNYYSYLPNRRPGSFINFWDIGFSGRSYLNCLFSFSEFLKIHFSDNDVTI